MATYSCSAQPQSIRAVPGRRVSLQCPSTKCPCSAQLQGIRAVPNRRVSLQCPTAEYPCSAQPQSIPAVPNCRVSLQCPAAEYPCSAQLQSMPNRRVSLQCPTAEFPQSSRKLYISCPTRASGWGCSKQLILNAVSSDGTRHIQYISLLKCLEHGLMIFCIRFKAYSISGRNLAPRFGLLAIILLSRWKSRLPCIQWSS